ncbi:hypothetical protein D3C85_1407720 [compost metagenome]
MHRNDHFRSNLTYDSRSACCIERIATAANRQDEQINHTKVLKLVFSKLTLDIAKDRKTNITDLDTIHRREGRSVRCVDMAGRCSCSN